MEALVCVFLRSFTGRAVDTDFLSVVCCGFADTLNGSEKVIVESCTDNWAADVVSKIPGANEEDVDALDLRNLFDLHPRKAELAYFSTSLHWRASADIFKCLSRLYLYDCNKGVVCL